MDNIESKVKATESETSAAKARVELKVPDPDSETAQKAINEAERSHVDSPRND